MSASFHLRRRFAALSLLFPIILFACNLSAPEPTEAPTPIVAPTTTTPPIAQEPALPEASPTAPPASQPEPTATLEAPPQDSIPDPEAYQWELVAGGFNQPLDLQHAGDGSGRLFVVEQRGLIRVIEGGVMLETTFLDIRDRVDSRGYEQGLLGLAFHPNYAENGHFYVNYTGAGGDTFISRFTVTAESNVADSNSEVILLRVAQPFQNHNGGGLAFGPDGYLYIGLGDGGSGGDPLGNGQSLQTLLGKILRLDVNAGEPYAIPSDNPYVDGGGLLEIWAYGLRNPWRFSFDRLTGDIYIADVGQNRWEEINFLPAGEGRGANFGWVYLEASQPYQGAALPAGLEVVNPVAEYDHAFGCSVTGGYVYRGQALPAWQGVYLYGDFCSGLVWGLLGAANGDWQERLLFELPFQLSSFGQDEAGELYLTGFDGGVYRLAAR